MLVDKLEKIVKSLNSINPTRRRYAIGEVGQTMRINMKNKLMFALSMIVAPAFVGAMEVKRLEIRTSIQKMFQQTQNLNVHPQWSIEINCVDSSTNFCKDLGNKADYIRLLPNGEIKAGTKRNKKGSLSSFLQWTCPLDLKDGKFVSQKHFFEHASGTCAKLAKFLNSHEEFLDAHREFSKLNDIHNQEK